MAAVLFRIAIRRGHPNILCLLIWMKNLVALQANLPICSIVSAGDPTNVNVYPFNLLLLRVVLKANFETVSKQKR